ncbi:hypothetical protein [Halovivax gelatinilyticus]|uniref:DUF7837 family putative zinc-binding protein n=1 Tax=Halovivax gelatinilyticus TaxID=2961597 RepID=UPI0020CA7DC1|nr:hypothetical protein [Halovivax gelatinilyticus]
MELSLTHPVTGSCPECHTPIPTSRVLIEYENDGMSACYAECPNCTDVVTPES